MLVVPLLIGVFSATAKYLTIETWDRRKLFRIRNINEYCTYSLIPVMSISIIGLEGVLSLMLIPVVFPIVTQLLISGRASLFLPKGHE